MTDDLVGPGEHEAPRLCDFIRARQDEIIATWTREVRRMSPARDFSRSALVDQLPDVLASIADDVETIHTGKDVQLDEAPKVHAVDRLAHGFDLKDVVKEYSLLKRCILLVWERDVGPMLTLTELRRLDSTLDEFMREAAARSVEGRERMLEALDRISAASLGSEELDTFLSQLLRATLETMEAVDLAAVFLREGDVLRMRAAVGQEEDVECGFTLRIGEGFGGRVAAEATPLLLGSGALEPLVRSEVIRRRGIKALYGVPLIHGGEVIGVAKIGSRTASEFAEDDKLLFRMMANRATAVIVQARLIAERRQAEEESARLLVEEQKARGEAERTLALLDALIQAAPVGIAFLDPELRYVRINDALATMNGRPAEEHLGRTVHEVLPDVAHLAEPLLQNVIATRQPLTNLEVEAPVLSTPGEPRSFLVNYFPVVSAHDEVLGVGGVVVEITERKRTEAAWRDSETRFRALADNISQLAWMADENGSIFWYNKRWFEYTGTTLDEMRGWGWQKVFHPDHVQRVVEKIRHHFETGEVWEDTFPLRGKDGGYRWFLSRAIPLRDERGQLVRWFGTNTDVTDERFLKEATALLASSLDYRKTLASIAKLAVPALADWSAVEVVTGSGKTEQLAIEHLDPSKVALARDLRRRFPPDPEASHGIAHVIRTQQPELYTEISAQLLEQRAENAEHLEVLRELGPKSAMVVPMVAHGRCVGALSFVCAESGRRYKAHDLDVAQELASRAAFALDNARLFREAHEAVRAREQILAVVSHDLRNPLGAISMSTAILLRRAPVSDTRSRKQLETIQRSARRMEHLIGDLLDMASIQAGHLAMEKRLHDVESLVVEAIELNESVAAEHGIQIERKSFVTDVRLYCDRERIMQVFSNLLGNAIKFCRRGDRITVRAEREDGHVRFSVRDTGPGISAEELPRLFEPYWSAGRHAKRGTGLGLFITKGIIAAHGGRIWPEANVGAGTTFHFTLPIAPSS